MGDAERIDDRPGLEEATRAWAASYAGLSQEQVDQRVLAFATLVQGIARAGAVSPEEFASKLGIGPARAKDLFANLATMGLQVDEQGNIVGAALTARQTPHRGQVGAKQVTCRKRPSGSFPLRPESIRRGKGANPAGRLRWPVGHPRHAPSWEPWT